MVPDNLFPHDNQKVGEPRDILPPGSFKGQKSPFDPNPIELKKYLSVVITLKLELSTIILKYL